jgi:penicillin-binding protein 2
MRKLLLALCIVLVGFVFIGRLFYLQVYSKNSNSILNDNAIRKVYEYPKRGFVYDRNGQLLVANQPSYDVMVIPREVKALDTLEFCSLLKISKKDFIKKYKKARNYSPRLPSVFVAQLDKEDYAYLQEKLHKYKGFHIQIRALRQYETAIGANVLGDIGEVSQRDIKKDAYYKLGDLIGKQGIEVSYENILRGRKGVKYIQKDRFNRNIGSFKKGIYDTLPIPGKDVNVTIDAKLQEYGEILMKNKRGGIIAIEPSTGEILAMIAAPSYNPNDLVGRKRSKNFTKLYNDSIAKPLFNRSLQGVYEPGSPFKLMNALVGLQEGVINLNEKITCRNGYKYGGSFMKCHCGFGVRNNVTDAIVRSCNAFFATTYRRILDNEDNASLGINVWSKHVKSFGLGNFLNNDLSVGQKGLIPDRTYYKNAYPKEFYSSYTISNAIGQGEVQTTPIQLANMVATIANRGFYYTPHIVKTIKGESLDKNYTTRKYTTIDKEHFEPVIEGMHQVYTSPKGTAYSLRVKDIEICGKTGTVQNYAIIDSIKTDLTDHSIFVAFAPKENPKIAIAVFVENGYFGSRFAGRITSLMIEQYLTGTITKQDFEDWILTHSLENEYAKPYSGKPFKINRETQYQIIEKNPKDINRIKALRND